MSEQVKLEKSLSPLQVCALALGSIVGWGCFVLPGDMFLPQAGPVGTLLGFFVGACLISFVAVCLSYMVKYAPVAGGAFAYAYIGFGPRAAFVCGWALVIGYLAIVAIDIAALSVIFRFLFPGVFEFGELYSIAGWTVYSGEVILMTAGTFFFGYINYRGIGFAGALQLILAFMLTFGILALFGGVLTLDTASVANLSPAFSDKRSMIACVLLVFAISPFLFVGFDTVPQKVMPEATDLFVFFAWILGGFVSGVSGIGGAMVAFPLLALVIPIHQLIALTCIINVVMDGCLAGMHFRHCRLSSLWPMLAGSVPGSFAGLYILQICSGAVLQGAVGLLLLYYVYWQMTYRAAQGPVSHPQMLGAAAGFGAGLLGTAISFDGPPIGAYGLCMGWEPRVFLGTLGVFFVIRGSLTVILQATAGFYTPEVLGYALYGAPGVILGTLLAFPVAKRIPQETFRKVLLVIIGVAGAVCLVRAFL